MEENNDLVRKLRVLGHALRLRIFSVLLGSKRSMRVVELVEKTHAPQSSVSEALRRLSDAQLVAHHASGYFAVPEEARRLADSFINQEAS